MEPMAHPAMDDADEMPSLNLEREIFQEETSASGLSGLLLVALAVPIVVFLFWAVSVVLG